MSQRTISLVASLALIAGLSTFTDAAPKKKKKKRGKRATPTKTEKPDSADEPSEPAPTPDPPPVAEPKPTTPAPAPTPPAPVPQTPAPGAGSAAAPDAKKPADEPPAPPVKAAKDDVDVDTLRQEYLALRDELFKSRARANAVASQLYSTRIQIKLTYTTARYYNPQKASIRLDGASVYENTTGAIGTDDGVRFEGYVAPGRHLITFRVEATGKDDDSFTSATESQIVVKAVPGKDLIVAAKARDGGDIAYEWKRKESGSYGLGIDVSVKTVARAEGEKGSKK